jgi:hypothetical protein
MGNRKIDQLPQFSGDTSGVHVVMNNASNTTTYTVTKETLLDGNNTFHGNQVVSGSLSISGTTTLGGDIVPLSPRGATLGTLELPFADIFVSSGSINIQSDVINGPNTTISNIGGNLLISAGGMRLVGDASFIAQTGSFQYISGSMEQVGNYTQTGNYVMNGNKTITGSLSIKSGSAFPQSTGSSLVTYNQTTGQFAHTSYKSALTPLLQGAGFYSTVTQSGSANVSSSFKFNNNITTDEIQIVSGSRIVCPTPATYNIQFSIQIVQGSGESDVVVWLKKNGSNVPDSASHIYVPSNKKVLVALNLWDQTTNPNDYYELAYQSNDNGTTYQYIGPSGNLPGSPSVILTINQVK